MVQHALLALLDFYHQGKLSLIEVVQKTSNGVAELYRIKERGFIREGYYADLVLIDLCKSNVVREDNLLYKCNWSPFLFHEFKSSIDTVFVNGDVSFKNNEICANSSGHRLKFEKIR
jgi:dihydroorotase